MNKSVYKDITFVNTIETTLFAILDFLYYVLLPERFDILRESRGYIGLLILVITFIWITWSKVYIEILDEYKNIVKNRKKILKIYSITYLIVLIFGYIYLSYLIREHNIENLF